MRRESALKHRELTEKVIGVFFEIYNELGHGFLESVYQKAFELALTPKGCMSAGRLRFQFGFGVRK
jgi:GxxExxY protein